VSLVAPQHIRVAAERLWNILCESEKKMKKNFLYQFSGHLDAGLDDRGPSEPLGWLGGHPVGI
jgi:hypothetical protein